MKIVIRGDDRGRGRLRPLRCAALIVVALICSGLGSAPGDAVAASEPAVPAARVAVVATTVTHAIAVKAPVGKCRRVKSILYGPTSHQQVCYYRIMVLGHAFPKPQKSGYLQRVINSMHVGSRVSYLGTVYRVVWKRSYRKGHLPSAVAASSGRDRYLVTCDTHSGYVNHHARNNLVVRLVRA